MASVPNSPPLPPGITECWAEIDGHRLRYVCGGSGPPLVLLHGLFAYSFSWRLNLPALAQHATVYAPDMLGFGFSDRCPETDCSMSAIAHTMLRFLDHLGLDHMDLLGTSHGGAIAMLMAAFGSEHKRVRRLILAAPVNPWSRHGRLITRVLATAAGAQLFRRTQPHISRHWVIGRLFGDSRRVPPDDLEGYGAALDIPGTIDHALNIARSWHQDLRELQAALPKIADIPTLLIWGSRDKAVLPNSAPKLAAQFTHAKLIMMDGIGHLPYEEAPDRFNRLVVDFLSSN